MKGYMMFFPRGLDLGRDGGLTKMECVQGYKALRRVQNSNAVGEIRTFLRSTLICRRALNATYPHVDVVMENSIVPIFTQSLTTIQLEGIYATGMA
jgi:hypothetical protein